MHFVGKCSSGWTEFRGCCYQASSYVTTWEKARDNCTANGANLVKIASAIENSFVLYLSNKFAPRRRQMWLDSSTRLLIRSSTGQTGPFHSTLTGPAVNQTETLKSPVVTRGRSAIWREHGTTSRVAYTPAFRVVTSVRR